MEQTPQNKTIFLRTGPCGSGKTRAQLEQIIGTPGHYLIAVETLALMAEITADIDALRGNRGIIVIPIASSGSSERSGSSTLTATTNCRATIEALPGTYENERHPHVIALCTHASLMSVSSDAFRKWHLVIDEVASIMSHETLYTEASSAIYERHFTLTPTAVEGRSIVTLKSSLDRAALGRDVMAKCLLAFYDRVVAPTSEVLCDVTNWKDIALKNASWRWWNVVSLDSILGFATITMLANNFRHSVFYGLVVAKHPEIVWQDIETPLWCEFAPRKLVINYFAEKHVGSGTLFRTPTGKRHLNLIGDHLRSTVVGDDHIWTSNAYMMNDIGDVPGERLNPRVAGSNRWSTINSATMIYSTKPNSSEVGVAETLGLSREIITQEREYEAIVQFAARTSVRAPLSTHDVTISCYDRDQADELFSHFSRSPHVIVEMSLIDLGFAYFIRARSNAAIEITPDEAACRKLVSNEKAKLQMAALRAKRSIGQPPKPRGRPRKHAGVLEIAR